VTGRGKPAEVDEEESATDQPRPALGRRPWFALLRRARSLRRFAFAMRTETVADVANHPTGVAPRGWAVGDVTVAAGFWSRWRGTKRRKARFLLRGRAIHGRGITAPLTVAALDADGTVLAVRRLEPGCFLVLRGAVWILELPPHDPRPTEGDRLGIYARRL
jgi:hypothetical protein